LIIGRSGIVLVAFLAGRERLHIFENPCLVILEHFNQQFQGQGYEQVLSDFATQRFADRGFTAAFLALTTDATHQHSACLL
jgi:hypothetical protein